MVLFADEITAVTVPVTPTVRALAGTVPDTGMQQAGPSSAMIQVTDNYIPLHILHAITYNYMHFKYLHIIRCITFYYMLLYASYIVTVWQGR